MIAQQDAPPVGDWIRGYMDETDAAIYHADHVRQIIAARERVESCKIRREVAEIDYQAALLHLNDLLSRFSP